MADLLNITLSKIQLSDGTWLLYYDGTALDLDCGTFFLKVDIDGTNWYSELFTIKEVSSGVHPELIKDISHIALRFYDSKLKQDYYKCKNLCDLGIINPIDHIIPFVIDISNLDEFDPDNIETMIICHDGKYAFDLSSDITYIINELNHIVYQQGNILSSQLMCGIYYLRVKLGSHYFYSEHFKVENITNVSILDTLTSLMDGDFLQDGIFLQD